MNLKVHETSLVLATGAMFLVPRGKFPLNDGCHHVTDFLFSGNTYFIENISQRNAKLFFTQARKIAPSEDEVEGLGAGAPHRLSSGAAVNAAVDVDTTTNARRSAGPRSSTAAPTTQMDGFGGRAMSKVPTTKRALSTKV